MQEALNQQVLNSSISNANMQANSREASLNYQASQLAKKNAIYDITEDSVGKEYQRLSNNQVQEIAQAFNQALIDNKGLNN